VDFDTFFTSGALPLLLADERGRISRLNQPAAQLLARSPGDLQDLMFTELVAGEDRQTFNRVLQTAREVPESTPSAVLSVVRDGELAPLRLTALAWPLPAAAQGMLLILDDRRDYALLEERVAYLSGIDPLTGLANRLLLNKHLTRLIEVSRSGEGSFALALLSVNRFQEINDSFGHDQGDLLMAEVAGRISNALPESAFLARSNGVRFILITEEERALPILEQVFEELGTPFLVCGQPVRVTVRAGICAIKETGGGVEELQRNAETALSQTTERFRNDYRIYHPEMKKQARIRLDLEHALVQALDREEFELYYQPLVDPRRGAVLGAEALLRWNHPARGLVLPLEFLPQIESAGLSQELGGWILKKACSQAVAWQQQQGPSRTSVNILADHFRGAGFVNTLGDLVAASGLDASGLELELTEKTLCEDGPASSRILGGLSELGVRVAIDDFGTGYSSLVQLKSYPVQTLKIDRSFIAGIPRDHDAAAIASAVISLGRILGLQVVAEGVETNDQLAYLHGLGCSRAQGFLFARPMPAAELTAWMQNGGRQLRTYPPAPPVTGKC